MRKELTVLDTQTIMVISKIFVEQAYRVGEQINFRDRPIYLEIQHIIKITFPINSEKMYCSANSVRTTGCIK